MLKRKLRVRELPGFPMVTQSAVAVIVKLVEMVEVVVMKTTTSIRARSFTYLFQLIVQQPSKVSLQFCKLRISECLGDTQF